MKATLHPEIEKEAKRKREGANNEMVYHFQTYTDIKAAQKAIEIDYPVV